MYRGRTWTMRQFAGFDTAEETNERFHYLIDEGQTGLSTAFDMPSLMGIDSDHPMSEGEVGKEGVAVDTLADMEVLFDGIDINEVSTSFTINPSAPVIYVMYVALVDQQGIPREEINGTLQNDMLKEFIAQKEWVIPPEPALEVVTDTIEFAVEETPKFHPVSVSGYHIREAGSTAAQEAAFTLADGFAYVEDCLERGLDIDEFAPLLSFFFNSHNSIFEEVAKFRASRRLFARVMEDWYGAERPKSKRLKFHTQTAGQSLTAQQPFNNIVRVTVQALAGVLGGTQSLHTNSFDEALALPSEKAVRSHCGPNRSSPRSRAQPTSSTRWAAVSPSRRLRTRWNPRSWSTSMRSRKWETGRFGTAFSTDRPGLLPPGDSRRELRIPATGRTRRKSLWASTSSRSREDTSPETLKIDKTTRDRQLERLERVKDERDDEAVDATLDDLSDAISNNENVMPYVIDAVKAYATMGEIMEVFEEHHGSYQEEIAPV